MGIARKIWLSLLSICAVAGASLFLTIALVQSDTRAKLLEAIKGPGIDEPAIKEPSADQPDRQWQSTAGEELIRANSQHWIIAYSISRCFPNIDISSGASKVSGMVANQLLIGTQPGGELRWSDANSLGDKIKLTTYQRTVLFLSHSISTIRSQANASAAFHQIVMYVLQISIVLVGATATILVSIKSASSKDSKLYRLIGIFAIVTSGASTALSSINSFIGPTDSHLRAGRTLHQARTAHLELSYIVAQDDKICAEASYDAKDDERLKKIREMSEKVREIAASNGSINNAVASTTPTNSSQPAKDNPQK